MTNLMTANNQWAKRAADERFGSLVDMLHAAKAKQARAKEATVLVRNLKVVAEGDDGLYVEGVHGRATPNNFAFEQMCRRLGFHPSAAQCINNELVADCLNYRIAESRENDPEAEIQFLIDQNDENVIKSATSEGYARIHDAEFIPWLQTLEAKGYRVPPCRPAFENQPGTRPARADEVGIWGDAGVQIKEGDPIAPGNLYMGDRDMFVMMANPTDTVDDGAGNALMRGLMAFNSEVGTRSLSIVRYNVQSVCGNAILWNVQDIMSFRYKHVGEIRGRMVAAMNQLDIKPAGWERELEVIAWMRRNKVGIDRDDVIDNLYRMKLDNALTKNVIRAAYDNAEKHEKDDGAPNTWYGIANALTRYSQTLANADARYALDMATGKLFDFCAKVLDSTK